MSHRPVSDALFYDNNSTELFGKKPPVRVTQIGAMMRGIAG
jgi:hypothetical protein